MRIFQLLILLFLWLPVELAAQSTSGISGTVIDQKTGERLTGATILAGGIASITNYDGGYSLDLLPGIYSVQVSYVGYEQLTLDITIESGVYLVLNAELIPSALMLETATVTSGRYERPLGETTVSLDIIKPRFVEHVNAISIDEALDRIPGVNMIDGQANIRGGSGFSYGAGSRVMLLVDDIPALQSDAGFPNWGDLPIENLEQIEVLKGAASALYGSSALNGIVNVRTAFAKSTPVTKVASFYTAYLTPKDKSARWWSNSPSTYGVNMAHRQKFGKLDLTSSMFYVNTRSVVQDAYDEQGRITLGLRYRLTDRLAVGINSNFNTGRSQSFFLWGNDTNGAYMGGGANNNSQSKKVRFFIDPYINYYDRTGSQHKLLGRIYQINNDNNLNQSNNSSLYYGEYQFQKNLSAWELVLTAGGLATYSAINAELYSDTTFSSRNMAAYLQLEKKAFEWLTLTGGVRLEHNAILTPDSIAGEFVPQEANKETKPIFRLGLNAQLSSFTFLRASWGQGYRFPTIAEKYIRTVFGGFQVIPNLQLRSETGWSAELGLKQGIKMGSWNGFIDIAGFWSEYQDMMEFTMVILPKFQSQNIGNTVIRGLEVAWSGEGMIYNKPLSMMVGYTYIQPKYKVFGEREMATSSANYNVLKYRFRHSVKADIELPLSNWFTLGASYQFNSHMEAIDAIFNLIPGVLNFRTGNNSGFHVLDFRAGFELHPKLEAWIILKNALNQAYTMRPAQMEAPRNLTLRLAWKL
ncbi:MAG: TonB-dependent receptor [Saprospiraceae bacterium]|nr:TonB-dependent receptor [Saprospiraceae bacterium]